MTQKHIPIFMTTDENYVRYVAITIASVCYNTREFCCFYILSDNVSDFRKHRIDDLVKTFDNLEIKWVDLTENHRQLLLEKFVKDTKNETYTKNVANYSRFLMPDLLPRVKRALYLDTDILVYGDIKDLYNYDLKKHVLGAVPDSYVLSDCGLVRKVGEYIDASHIYFNAGILLIDCDKWRKDKTFDKLVSCDKEIRNVKLFNTQDPLNKCFENDYALLPHKYNWYGDFKMLSCSLENVIKYITKQNNEICIRHFPGRKPDVCPWQYSNQNVADMYFFARMTGFYDDVKAVETKQAKTKNRKIKLFGFIPFIKIRKDKIYLFNFIKLFKVVK